MEVEEAGGDEGGILHLISIIQCTDNSFRVLLNFMLKQEVRISGGRLEYSASGQVVDDKN